MRDYIKWFCCWRLIKIWKDKQEFFIILDVIKCNAANFLDHLYANIMTLIKNIKTIKRD